MRNEYEFQKEYYDELQKQRRMLDERLKKLQTRVGVEIASKGKQSRTISSTGSEAVRLDFEELAMEDMEEQIDITKNQCLDICLTLQELQNEVWSVIVYLYCYFNVKHYKHIVFLCQTYPQNPFRPPYTYMA